LETSFLAEIHPKVIHFPVALLTTYSVLEIVGIIFKKEFLSKSALLILCLGVITAFLAVLTGNQAATDFLYWSEESSALLSQHQANATYLLWLSAITCGIRLYALLTKKFAGYIRYGFLILAVIILFLVIRTGLYGGDLVTKYGIGTDLYQNYEVE